MPPRQHATVDAFLADLDPALRPILEGVAKIILSADPAVKQGIKWNCVSFYVNEYFAALNVRPPRAPNHVQLVFHTGAKVKALPEGGLKIPDPDGILTWVAPDRATVAFSSAADVDANRSALHGVVQAWVASM